MKAIMLCALVIACGRESDSSDMAVTPIMKNISMDTASTAEADRIEFEPYCLKSCDVLRVKDDPSPYFCTKDGGDWIRFLDIASEGSVIPCQMN